MAIVSFNLYDGMHSILTVDHDPEIVPTDCCEGDIIICIPTKKMYLKNDDGETINITGVTSISE